MNEWGPWSEGCGSDSWIQVSVPFGYCEKGLRLGASIWKQVGSAGLDFGETNLEKYCFGESLKERFSKYKGLMKDLAAGRLVEKVKNSY